MDLLAQKREQELVQQKMLEDLRLEAADEVPGGTETQRRDTDKIGASTRHRLAPIL